MKAERNIGVAVVIPALNEEESIAGVVRAIPRDWVDKIVVVDNGSTDRTAERAAAAGAVVVREPRPGYGRACRAGVLAFEKEYGIVAFLDGDGSDCPEMIDRILEPIVADRADFVIGSRTRGKREKGSMNFQQLFAARLFGVILQLLYGVRYSDMGPFRAIRTSHLRGLNMRELTYGWNLEMQMQAARQRLRILEVPVDHRCRTGGQSKVSGSLRGTVRATGRIFSTLFRVALQRQRE